MLAAYIVGGSLWAMVVFYFTWTALQDRKPRPRHHHSPLILLYSEERVRRHRRAMKRAGRIETFNRPRLGIDVDLNHEKAAASRERPAA